MSDDYFALGWPGVTDGYYRFMFSPPVRDTTDVTAPTLVPFAVGYNKLFLTTPASHHQLFVAIHDSHVYAPVRYPRPYEWSSPATGKVYKYVVLKHPIRYTKLVDVAKDAFKELEPEKELEPDK